MKKCFKIILAAVLAAVMLGAVLVTGAADTGYRVGDMIEYGTYPQSDVTDSLGDILNAQDGTWKSYNYYSGSGDNWGGDMKPSDYMRYKDVMYNGDKYRGVTFDSYRPGNTGFSLTPDEIYDDHTYQDDHGYDTGNVYWFKFEPIKWKVLDPSDGLVMCSTVIDSQAYNNYIMMNGTIDHEAPGDPATWGDPEQTYYANNYARSSIRQWLNFDFYNTAFSGEQKANIKTTALNNGSLYTVSGYYNSYIFDAPSTNDKIFLLSWDEAKNSAYGFAEQSEDPGKIDLDPALIISPTAYAKCQGLMECEGFSFWWLRTPGAHSWTVCTVTCDGYIYNVIGVEGTWIGVVPAMKLNKLYSDNAGSDAEGSVISIHNCTAEKTVDYMTTVTFSIEPLWNPVTGAEIHWFIDGRDAGAGETYTVIKAKKSFTVQAKYIKDGRVLADSGIEAVKVRTDFFARLKAFFRAIFGRLPKVVQTVPGVDIVDGVVN